MGNLIFPLIADSSKYFIYACDFSPRAVDFVKSNPLYDEEKVKAFTCDITKADLLNEIPEQSLDIITVITYNSSINLMTNVSLLLDDFRSLRHPSRELPACLGHVVQTSQARRSPAFPRLRSIRHGSAEIQARQ